MKKLFFFLLFAVVVMILSNCEKDTSYEIDSELLSLIKRASKTGEIEHYIMPDSDDYNALPNQEPANPINYNKVKLGQMLFFETGLAQKPNNEEGYETYSCSSCHLPTAGFLPGRIQGIADGGIGYGINGEGRTMMDTYEESSLDAQGTRPMNPMNSTFVTNTLWSGLFGAGGVNEGTEEYWTGLAEVNHTGYTGLEAQNIEAFDLHRLEINERVLDEFGYRSLYDEAFPEFEESERYSPVTSSFAISAFLRTMMSNEAPFQNWLKGDYEALSTEQKKGAILFFDKAKCYYCHQEASFSAMNFHVMGTKDMHEMGGLNTGPDDVRNLGRGMFTGKESDMFAFKVPQLYNLKDYVSYFHGSSKDNLKDVVEFKLRASSENSNVSNDMLSPLFNPVSLTEDEKTQLLNFLENGLRDPNLVRYMPSSVLSGNCFPNNDHQSREDIGCN